MPSATEIEDRIRAGFADLLEQLRAGLEPSPDHRARLNAEELARRTNEVRDEYLAHGLEPPSAYALSLTARRDMAERDETRQAAE